MNESETIECKTSLTQLKKGIISIAAILNKHQKGSLFFGIRDNGEIVGQDIDEKTLRDISTSISNNIEPKIYPEIRKILIKGKYCVKIDFSGESIPYMAYGRVYIRVTDEDRQLSAKEIRNLILKSAKEEM